MLLIFHTVSLFYLQVNETNITLYGVLLRCCHLMFLAVNEPNITLYGVLLICCHLMFLAVNRTNITLNRDLLIYWRPYCLADYTVAVSLTLKWASLAPIS